ncbi:outer membrane protein assembly factor BamD [Helicobacter cappadocius]|uniref:Outer membrane protein assembly factor BamD n=1 Tax=Helicobacter cappadocius TaxID=3063998 RepID=A0AA90SRW0_9HELI|nr:MULTISPECIES: outer membrane protein assembly factor BamD [unclassified Helicobacter]MDO7252382.1 outer membrane protein assembly factor BamD [Helicobacter sp. faydin-H75]MDP2538249.1 outer membrane protein assembly factor BamD [Helicobacter sp. faydin-H76]
MNYRKIVCLVLPIIVFIGCAKTNTEYNKPAMYWYQGILKEIKFGNLEGADNYYSSLQSEHINSPLLPDAMLILGQAHMSQEEYILAEFYFDEYLKRYGTIKNADYIAFLKLKSHYYAFKNQSKDQEFVTDTIQALDDFVNKYPNSRYIPYVEYMQVKFVLGQNELNKAIANVYKKQHKKEAVQKYLDRIDEDLEKEAHPTPSHIPWYVFIFNW